MVVVVLVMVAVVLVGLVFAPTARDVLFVAALVLGVVVLLVGVGTVVV